MIELTPGKEKWRRKAQFMQLECHCWDCLRKAGITPAHNSPPQHRSTVIVGKIYRTDNGLGGKAANGK